MLQQHGTLVCYHDLGDDSLSDLSWFEVLKTVSEICQSLDEEESVDGYEDYEVEDKDEEDGDEETKKEQVDRNLRDWTVEHCSIDLFGSSGIQLPRSCV